LYPVYPKMGPKQSKLVLFKNLVGNVSPLLSKYFRLGPRGL